MEQVPGKKLRIAFVTNNYTPFSGGVVSSINASVAQLQKQGHTVCIITLDFLGDDHHKDACPSKPWRSRDADHIIRLASPIKFKYKQNHMAMPWRANKQMLAVLTQFAPDLIHSHHPFLLGKSAVAAARTLNVPILFTFHTLYEKYVHYIPLHNAITRPAVNKLVRAYCNKVDRIIAPTTFMQSYIQGLGVTTSITVLPSAIQDYFLQQIDQPIILPCPSKPKGVAGSKCIINWTAPSSSPENGLPSGCPDLNWVELNDAPFNLLLVSRFTKEKNIPFLLNVFAQLKDQHKYTFTLVGYGDEYESLQAYAYQKLGLSSDRVIFVHKPEQAELLSLYQRADLFLFSSLTDTQGLVLAEAMASGNPVIALNGPGQRAIIVNGVNGFLVANEQEMLSKIEEIANDLVLHAQLKTGACQTALAYAPEFIGEQLIACYLDVLNN